MFLPQKAKNQAAGKQSSAQEAEQAARLRPWVEKYRPKTIEDVTAQEHTVAVLRKTLMSSNLPHMLFYGPPGTGKTSTILALARQLFGPELMRSRVLELNASDERGITVVREKIKNFAKTAVSNANVDFPCPPYKIIILDEADSMTQDAQSALRRIMEQYSRITRFCLVCNYVTRIIEPLASRCSKFRFRMLDTSSTRERLEEIAKAERVSFEDGVLDTLIDTSDGDLRRAITYLQSASRLHGAGTASSTPITRQSIVEIAGVVPSLAIRALGKSIGVDPPPDEDGNVDDGDVEMLAPGPATTPFEIVQKQVKSLAMEGFSTTQLLLQLHDYIMLHPLLTAKAKAKCAIDLGDADKALIDGGDEELQLFNLSLKLRASLTA
ncbi:putative RFC2-DNA replication factor C, 41 kd subunit [Ceraceosorus guamensis]|uniref:Putative RFC2-DNA replication factor C, 41 kd subunit n=1 Tax=Ceraceosorus guamensis TaxID=1522189 RepID=A0A316VTJ2_9BASI|nr:putative RFC2-DNA replication factor C, 41 kd subunit [Ceraceosorus guamensis]PWN40907.1 putative RFC2-DNA replication factor C, 41 kd subunit [Ceraceosorus guamensis]